MAEECDDGVEEGGGPVLEGWGFVGGDVCKPIGGHLIYKEAVHHGSAILVSVDAMRPVAVAEKRMQAACQLCEGGVVERGYQGDVREGREIGNVLGSGGAVEE